jgi:hypothetical protein
MASSTPKEAAASRPYRDAYRDGPFWYVDPIASAAELPARFGASFPKVGEPLRPWPRTALPREVLEARLWDGDTTTRSAYEAWLRDAVARLDTNDLWGYRKFLWYADASWLRAWRAREENVRVRAVLDEELEGARESASDPVAPSKPTAAEKAAFARALRGDASEEWAALELRGELVSMAMSDRTVALEAARTLVRRGKVHPFLMPVTQALVEFPEPGSFEAWLADHELTASRDPAPPWLELAIGKRWLTYEGTLVSHEPLLYGAARATGSALADVHFEDLGPDDAHYADALASFGESGADDEVRVLTAYADQKVHRARVRRRGSYLEVPSTLGLLNSILRERNSKLRLVSVLTNGDVVVAGPEKGLREAIQRKLLLTDPGPEAAELIDQERQFQERLLEDL